MKLKYLILIILVTGLAACDKQQFSTDQETFEAYLKTKRIPLEDETRVERQRAEYLRRAALANAIYKSDQLDRAQIDAELEEFRKELIISRYFEGYLQDAVTEQGIQNYYSENIDSYRSNKIRISHILLRVNPRMEENERQAVLTRAMAAHSRLTSGDDFAVVAKEVSEDKVSAAKGGDLGWINEGAISQTFSDKVFAMKSDEVSEPFLTDYGFHIVKVTEDAQQVTKPLEAIKGDIRYQLRRESKKAETQRLLDSEGYKRAG